MNTFIRNSLEVGDVGSIVYLHGILYAKEYGYDHTFEAYVAESLGAFAKRSNLRERIWIVEKNKEVLGSIALCEVSSTEAQLRWFLVSPKLRGQGLGKRLISELLDFAKENSYQTISLWTVKGLEAAKNLYLSSGFTFVKEVEHSVWGSIHTEQQYTIELNAFNKTFKMDTTHGASKRR